MEVQKLLFVSLNVVEKLWEENVNNSNSQAFMWKSGLENVSFFKKNILSKQKEKNLYIRKKYCGMTL